MREIAHMIVMLMVTAMVSGAGLAAINEVTAPAIEEQILKNKKAPAIAEILEGYDNDPVGERVTVTTADGAEVVVFPASKGGDLFGVAIEGAGKGYGGDVNVIVGIDVKEEGRLYGIGITGHAETPGLGARCTEDAFRGQFAGKQWDGKSLDAITGATITSNAVRDAINVAVDSYAANKDQIVK